MSDLSIGGRQQAAAVFVFVCVLCLVCTVHALRTLTTGLTYKIKLSLCKKRVFRERVVYDAIIPFVLANDNRHIIIIYINRYDASISDNNIGASPIVVRLWV
jgi:hypothetical protein